MKELLGLEDLRGALAHEEGPVVLFKHSTRCSISAGALDEVQAFARKNPQAAFFTIVDLLAHRNVSEAIEAELGVRHESPQAIVVDHGGVRAVLNHGAIRARTLGALLLPVKPVLCLQHVAAEGPGTIQQAVVSRGGRVRVVRIFEREPVPRSLAEIGALVVMGGPMGVYQAREHPHLDEELRLIGLALEAELPILGVCLGSQLLAAASGARVYPSGGKEIGWHEVQLRPEAQQDPLFGGLDRRFTGFHWHGDVFTLPPGAVSLAWSQKTEHQAFRVGRLGYGLLFHLEVTRPQVVEMVGLFGDELAQARIEPGTLLSDLEGRLSALETIATTVFGRWADQVLAR